MKIENELVANRKNPIRFVTQIGAWILGFIAPIKGLYEYISSGKLASYGVTVHIGIWDLLTNLCYAAGLSSLMWAFYFFVTSIIFPLPIVFVMGLLGKDEDAQNRVQERLIMAIAVLTALPAIAAFFGGVLESLKPGQKLQGLDWILVAVGGFILFGAYLYIYLAATGQLDES